MDKTMLDELAYRLNSIMFNAYGAEETKDQITWINEEIAKVAMREVGVSSSDLADEDQEDSQRVRHYWAVASQLHAQVYMRAGVLLSSYEGWN